jgi:hypothetical protein
MNGTFTITYNRQGDYIHISSTSDYEIEPTTLSLMWKELASMCSNHSCLKAYHDGPVPKRRMKTSDAFTAGNLVSETIPGLMMAICFEHYRTDETTRFFLDVAANRGVQVKFCSSKEEAMAWLDVEKS